jgi:hypothetical protein
MFAGMNMDGRAQWLLDTPGKEAISLDDYMSQEDFKEKMTLLCDEGERPSVVDVVRMLGCALRVNVNSPYNDVARLLTQMKDYGLFWERGEVMLKIQLFKNPKTSRRSGYYSMIVSFDDIDEETIVDVDGFTKVRDMLDTGDDFFEVLRNEAGFRPSMRLEIERELDRNLPKKLLEKYSKKRVY